MSMDRNQLLQHILRDVLEMEKSDVRKFTNENGRSFTRFKAMEIEDLDRLHENGVLKSGDLKQLKLFKMYLDVDKPVEKDLERLTEELWAAVDFNDLRHRHGMLRDEHRSSGVPAHSHERHLNKVPEMLLDFFANQVTRQNQHLFGTLGDSYGVANSNVAYTNEGEFVVRALSFVQRVFVVFVLKLFPQRSPDHRRPRFDVHTQQTWTEGESETVNIRTMTNRARKGANESTYHQQKQKTLGTSMVTVTATVSVRGNVAPL